MIKNDMVTEIQPAYVWTALSSKEKAELYKRWKQLGWSQGRFCKKNGISVSMKHDVIIDEIDVYLDPNAQINMVKTNPMTTNMAWIYPQINAFVEMHSKSNSKKHIQPCK